MSPYFSSAGPATVRRRRRAPRATIWARVVFRAREGPASRTWSSASPRAFVASRAIPELLLDPLLPDEVVEPTRAQRALDLLVLGVSSTAATTLLAHSSSLDIHAARREPHPFRREQLGTSAKPLLRLDPAEKPSSTSASRATRWVGVSSVTATAPPRHQTRSCPSARGRSAPAVFLPMPGIAWKRRSRPGRSRGEARRRRAGDHRERDLRPDAADREQLREQLALVGVREAVELQRVLAHVQEGLDRQLSPAVGPLSTPGVAATR